MLHNASFCISTTAQAWPLLLEGSGGHIPRQRVINKEEDHMEKIRKLSIFDN